MTDSEELQSTGATANKRKRRGGNIQFAEVIFSSDKTKKIVSISDIQYDSHSKKSIKPLHVHDFDKKHKYLIKWYHCDKNGDVCKKKHNHPFDVYGGYIYHLGGKLLYSIIYQPGGNALTT